LNNRVELEQPTQLAEGVALIFDMDGVLIDSNPVHRRAWEVFNRRFGIETTEAMHESMYGKRNDDIVRRFFGELPEAEVISRGAAKEELYREMIAGRIKSFLVPGLCEFLQRYRQAPMAVASNAERANLDCILDGTGLRPYFRVVLDGSQVAKPKPHPEIYLRAADELGVPPANCVVFEDSHSGVQSARQAGMKVIGICTTHGYLPGTDLNVDNFWSGDLTEWLAAQTRAV
jgi:beta-phosphoglucomutase family hydrolase